MLLERLKRWLGWNSDSGLLDFSRPDVAPARRSACAQASAADRHCSRPAENRTAPAQRRTKTERSPADVLHNPRLTLDKPADDGFDPYNTGAFNRSQSWDSIGRQRKR